MRSHATIAELGGVIVSSWNQCLYRVYSLLTCGYIGGVLYIYI